MNKPTFKELYYLCVQKLTNFPYIEEDFDALTNYELLCKVVEELNKMIDNMNTQNESIIALYNAFNTLKTYVDNYFENLDVQEEINNKLDEMASSGELTNLIKGYVDPIYQAYEEEINEDISSFKSQTNNSINELRTEVESIASGSPIPVSSTSDMTDTTKVYLLLTDGYVYYYNGTNWTRGWVYQSTYLNLDDRNVKNIQAALNLTLLDTTPVQNNKMVNTSGSTVDLDTTYTVDGGGYYIYDAIEGDIFSISGVGASNYRLYAFIDSNNNIIEKSPGSFRCNNKIIVAPANTNKLVINSYNTAFRLFKGYYSINKKMIDSDLKYKADKGISKDQLISTNVESGLYNVYSKTVDISSYNHATCSVNGGEYYYVSGKTSGGNPTIYPLIAFYDNNNNLINEYFYDVLAEQTDALIQAPFNATKAVVNSTSSNLSLYSSKTFEKSLEYVNNLIPINTLSNKQVGVFSKPYVCFTSDDGENTLATNTIPNIIEKVYQDTNVKVPFTFGLMSNSPIFSNTTYINMIIDKITNYNCSVAIHGDINYTNVQPDALIRWLNGQKNFIESKGIVPNSIIYPYHDYNNTVASICGNYYGVCATGGTSSDLTKVCNSPRKNMYALYRTSVLDHSLNTLESIVDYAFDKNYLLIFYIHDGSFVDETNKNKLIDLIEYCITKQCNFCNLGEIPNLV